MARTGKLNVLQTAIAFGCAAGLLGAQAAQARTPRALDDLVGARAAGAETAMEDRDFRRVSTDSRDRLRSFWWNERSRECVEVYLNDGRFEEVDEADPEDCGVRGNEGHGNGSSHGNSGHHNDSYRLPEEITGLVGNKRKDAEDKLERQGYQSVDGGKGGDRTYSTWWNRSRGDCLRVEAKDGRIRSIDRADRRECD